MQNYAKRRDKLLAQLPENSIVIIPGAKTLYRNNDTEIPFRQNSDVLYLCGISEANTWIILEKAKGKNRFIVLNEPKDPAYEVWTGKRIGQSGACEDYLADDAYDVSEINQVIPNLLLSKEFIYFPFTNENNLARKVHGWLLDARSSSKRDINFPNTTCNILPILHRMRMLKDAEEVKAMRQAAQISASAHISLMQKCKPGMYEYELEAEFFNYCRSKGCTGLAYPSIVASGNNANTLHYTLNNRQMQDGDLVLIDAGGEYNYYAADITRTFPVNKKFTDRQQDLYQLVLSCQQAGISQAVSGNIWNKVQEVILQHLVQGLVDLKILKGNVEDLITNKAYSKFYMHGSGHWLGLDVHDAGEYKTCDGDWVKLQDNMVLTVEPGIYIDSNINDVDPKWSGIGIRIEDDVLVCGNTPEVLTSTVPKEIDDLYEMMSG